MAKARSKAPQGRRDPKRRSGEMLSWNMLADQDPERHYVWVNTGDRDALSNYRMGGYTPVLWEFDDGDPPVGARPLGYTSGEGGPRKGAEIVVADNLLMSISKAELLEIEQHGRSGMGLGLEYHDRVENRMTEPNIMDRFRGRIGAGMTVTPHHESGARHDALAD